MKNSADRSGLGTVTLNSGEDIPVRDLLDRIPYIAYTTPLHIDVCEVLASRSNLPTGSHNVYVNYLRLHSAKARAITALATLIRSSQLVVRTVDSSFISTDLTSILGSDIEIQSSSCNSNNLIDLAQVWRVIIKILAHRFYRVFSRKLERHDSVVRTWVEVSEHIYENEFPNSNILIYPFYLNTWRHIKYVRGCFKRYPSTSSLVGLPYKWSDILSLLRHRKTPDLFLVKTEVEAFGIHAKEIAEMSPECVFTTDEFEVASVELCLELRNRGIKTVNTAHGLGMYCPYVAYDQFTVLNRAQKEYYEHKSQGVTYVVEERENRKRARSVNMRRDFSPVVVLLDGNFIRSDLVYERRYQESYFDIAVNLCRENGVRCIIKMHPNSSLREAALFRKQFGVETHYNTDVLEEENPIFINSISTAYYDFKHLGPFIFVSEKIVPLRTLFGFDVRTVAKKELNEAISLLLELQEYRKAMSESQ